MRLILAQLSLRKFVVLNEGAVCGANVGAASALHTKENALLLKSCHSVLEILELKRLSKGGGVEVKGTRVYASAAMDAYRGKMRDLA